MVAVVLLKGSNCNEVFKSIFNNGEKESFYYNEQEKVFKQLIE